MNKILKTFLFFIFFTNFLFFTSCTNANKYKALYEYEDSLKLDLIYYDQFEITSKQIFSATSYKEKAAYLGIMEDNIKKLKENAELRNSLIEDPEVKEIDDCYVEAITNIYNSYKVIHEGIYENNENKYKTGLANMENAIDSFSKYIDKFESYTLRYELKMEDASGIRDEISLLRDLY